MIALLSLRINNQDLRTGAEKADRIHLNNNDLSGNLDAEIEDTRQAAPV